MKYTCTHACEILGICNIFGCKLDDLKFYSMLNFTNVHENLIFICNQIFYKKAFFGQKTTANLQSPHA